MLKSYMMGGARIFGSLSLWDLVRVGPIWVWGLNVWGKGLTKNLRKINLVSEDRTNIFLWLSYDSPGSGAAESKKCD